jgi:beta-barrel assembly-enhancing protease
MKSLRYFLLCGLVSFSACNMVDSANTPKGSGKVTYSYTCLDSAVSGSGTNKAISRTTGLIRDLAVSKKEITDDVQSDYGDAFHKDAVESKTFVLLSDPAIQAQLQQVLSDLLSARENPSAIRYSIYLLDDKQVNAFTFGGHVYLTKAMYDKCKGNTDLLYSIIGHEIGHSEKGHIKKTIQEMELSEKIFGQEGISYFQLKQLLAGSFNQKNELEADYYGIDLANNLNKNLCATVTFWQEMAKGENNYSKLEDFFRTHPFSSLRAQCLQDHIQQNFGSNCTGK